MARRMSKAERTLPSVFVAVMFAMVVLLLPTVLRPVDPLTNESAEFSPDAPPDENESIVAALNRGTTATSGSGDGVGDSPNTEAVAQGIEEDELVEAPPPPKGRASRGRCSGNPPRQVESVYGPPCVEAFVGTVASRGAKVIKVALGANGLDPGLLPIVVATAHDRGLRVAAHALGDGDAAAAAAAGCDLLAHTPLDRKSVV